MIWPNGRTADFCFEIILNKSVNSQKRLKDCIVANISKVPIDRLRIFNYKGIEIDDADIPYLNDNQTLYVSVDGKIKYYYLGANFSINNYVNEHEFIYWIKSGGYGKVFMGRYIIFFIYFFNLEIFFDYREF